MSEKRRTTIEEARRVGDLIGVDWQTYDVEQFRLGMEVEFEHGRHDPQTDVTHDDPVLTGKIALAHMKEFPDYYERLGRMEAEAKEERAAHSLLLLLRSLLRWRLVALEHITVPRDVRLPVGRDLFLREIAVTGHSGTQAPQSMHSSGSM